MTYGCLEMVHVVIRLLSTAAALGLSRSDLSSADWRFTLVFNR